MSRTIYLWQLILAVFLVSFLVLIVLFSLFTPEKVPQSAVKVIVPFYERFEYLRIR